MTDRQTREFAQRQVAAMDQFLSWAGGDPLMGPGLRARRDEFARQAEELPPSPATPRAILFFTGEPVDGSRGIEVEFMTKVLEHFQQMVKTQYAFAKNGSIGNRARQPGGAEAKLMLTGTPRGSFGLELSQPHPHDLFSAGQLSKSLVQLTQLIKAAGEDDETFGVELDDVTPRVLQRLRRFFKLLSDSKASLRLESGSLSVRMDQARVRQASERVAAVTTKPEKIEIKGEFRGATLDTWRFDFRTEEGGIINGKLAADITEEAAVAMNQHTAKQCVGQFERVQVISKGGILKERFELLSIAPLT